MWSITLGESPTQHLAVSPLLPISSIRLSQILTYPRGFLGFLPDSPVAFEIVTSPCLLSGTRGSRLVTILSDVIYF